MKRTEKIYDTEPHARTFRAKVICCVKTERGYECVLDRTAFFPEGGGQACDTGILGGARVICVYEKNGVIYHITDAPISGEADGEIDYEQRFSRMQNHSGEHIVSGIIHTLYGFDNVGFHMGNDDVTLDVNGTLTREQIDDIERRANRAVWENRAVTVSYPTGAELAVLDYRAKLELTENVRIVRIDGIDCCACCAPHVERTGEIGIIKLLDFANYKSGVRIHMLCGERALCDYNKKYQSVYGISCLLSAKQAEVCDAVSRLHGDNGRLMGELSAMKREIISLRTENIAPDGNGNILFFTDNAERNIMRDTVNGFTVRCDGICGIFAGGDGNYRYILGSKTADLTALSRKMNKTLGAKGGGSREMIQGSVCASDTEIRSFFQNE